MKVRVQPSSEGLSYWLWCPACDRPSMISDSWGWNGDQERPTFTPSLLTRYTTPDGVDQTCHSFIVEWVWQYLGDCTHAMAGQHVPMVDLPDWVAV